MDKLIRLNEDWHVRTDFTDGSATARQCVVVAQERELSTICLVGHVRRSTGWVREFVEANRAAGSATSVEVNCALEADVLDTNGMLDAPSSLSRADFVFLSLSQLPTPRGPMDPEEARQMIAAGRLLPAQAVEWVVRAYSSATQRYDNVVLSRPFSLLDKLGLDERHLHPPFVRWLASELADSDGRVVIDESLRCPDLWVTGSFLAAGVPVHVSTRSCSVQTIGRYEWCREVADGIAESDRSPALATCGIR
jgi:putative hydrolase